MESTDSPSGSLLPSFLVGDLVPTGECSALLLTLGLHILARLLA